MPNIVFENWNILHQKHYDVKADSFYVKEANPSLEPVLLECPRLYLFRPNFEPLWEKGHCRGRLNSPLSKLINELEFAEIMIKFAASPALHDEKLAGVYYGYKRQVLRIWLSQTASEADVARIRDELTALLDIPFEFEQFTDPDWKAVERPLDLSPRSKMFEIYRSASSIGTVSFETAITAALPYIDSVDTDRIAEKLKESFIAYDFACTPLTRVKLSLRECRLELTMFGNEGRRCNIYAKYDPKEFLVLFAAEWKRRIVRFLYLNLPDFDLSPVIVKTFRLEPIIECLFTL
uniref:WYL domain-containing protein n=1 Tax=Panagrellus redivivus TaxID=6233 RepID=A0A7E4US67_PANRE